MCIYSANLNKSMRRWVLAIIIALAGLAIRSNIQVPYINMGSNVFIGGIGYENSIFSKELPPIVYKKLNEEFILKFPDSLSSPDKNLFEISVTQMINKNSETKKIKEINWKNRYQLALGSFNNTKYNAYAEQQPNRKKLPYFVKYTIPKEYDHTESKFCWKGFAYFKADIFQEKFNKKKGCIDIKKYYGSGKKNLELWLIDTGDNLLEAELISPSSIKIRIYIIKLTQLITSLTILFILFNNFNFRKVSKYICTFIITFLFAVYYNPTILSKFVLFEGGNDGLLYVHFAHLISENIAQGNYYEAFRGGESVFDLMPFYRYVWVLNYFLFEEAPWLFFFTLNALPLVIYYILKALLDEKWASVLIICWFILPVFEAFGFFHFYYVKLTLRGFAEPLAYLMFLSALAIILKIFHVKKKLYNYSDLFWIGLLFSIAIGLRANILPACLVMLLFLLYKGIQKKYYLGLFYLFSGLSLTLSIPFHNYYFSNSLVPLTIAAYKDWNLGASPSDYLNLIYSIFLLNFDMSLWNKIISHINGEIKLYEIWYHSGILACIFCVFKKTTPTIIKFISVSGLSIVSMLLFYHVGGRYSYLSWTLTLIILCYCLKNYIYPNLKNLKI